MIRLWETSWEYKYFKYPKPGDQTYSNNSWQSVFFFLTMDTRHMVCFLGHLGRIVTAKTRLQFYNKRKPGMNLACEIKTASQNWCPACTGRTMAVHVWYKRSYLRHLFGNGRNRKLINFLYCLLYTQVKLLK